MDTLYYADLGMIAFLLGIHDVPCKTIDRYVSWKNGRIIIKEVTSETRLYDKLRQLSFRKTMV